MPYLDEVEFESEKEQEARPNWDDANPYDPLIMEMSSKHQVDPFLSRAVARTESNFNPKARSSAGAQGLFQLMPKTAKGLGVMSPFDPRQNADGGVKYLGQMLTQFKGDVPKSLAAYNHGPGNVRKLIAKHGDKWIEHLPKETKDYIPTVMNYYKAFSKTPQQAKEEVGTFLNADEIEFEEDTPLKDDKGNEINTDDVDISDIEPLADAGSPAVGVAIGAGLATQAVGGLAGLSALLYGGTEDISGEPGSVKKEGVDTLKMAAEVTEKIAGLPFESLTNQQKKDVEHLMLPMQWVDNAGEFWADKIAGETNPKTAATIKTAFQYAAYFGLPALAKGLHVRLTNITKEMANGLNVLEAERLIDESVNQVMQNPTMRAKLNALEEAAGVRKAQAKGKQLAEKQKEEQLKLTPKEKENLDRINEFRQRSGLEPVDESVFVEAKKREIARKQKVGKEKTEAFRKKKGLSEKKPVKRGEGKAPEPENTRDSLVRQLGEDRPDLKPATVEKIVDRAMAKVDRFFNAVDEAPSIKKTLKGQRGSIGEGRKEVGKRVADEANSVMKGIVKYDGEWEFGNTSMSQFTTHEDFGKLPKGQTIAVKGDVTLEKLNEALIKKAEQYEVEPGNLLEEVNKDLENAIMDAERMADADVEVYREDHPEMSDDAADAMFRKKTQEYLEMDDRYIESKEAEPLTEYTYTELGYDKRTGEPRQVEIVKNPTQADYSRISKEVKREFPNSTEPKTRTTYDNQGNKYIWRADHGAHSMIEPVIEKKYGIRTSQNPEIEFGKQGINQATPKKDWNNIAKLLGVKAKQLNDILGQRGSISMKPDIERAMKRIQKDLNKLTKQAIEEGKTLKEYIDASDIPEDLKSLYTDDLFSRDKRLPEKMFNEAIDVIIDTIKDPAKTFEGAQGRRVMYDIVDYMKNNPEEFKQILQGENITPEQFIESMREGFRAAGRTLNKASQVQKLIGEVFGKFEGLDKVPPNGAWDKIFNMWYQVDRVRRTIMVSQLATAIRNVISQGGYYSLGIVEDSLNGLLKTVTGQETPKMAFGEAAQDIGAMYRKLTGQQKARLDKVFKLLPELPEELLGAPIHDIPTNGKFSKVMMFFNRVQENFFRKTIFDGSFTNELNKRGLDINNLEGLTTNQQVAMHEALEVSLEKALRMTFAKNPDVKINGMTGGQLLYHFNRIPLLTTVVPFPRFWANAMKFIWDFNPTGLTTSLYKAMKGDPAGATRALSKAMVGTGMLGMALEMRKSKYAGENYYEFGGEVKKDGSREYADLRAFAPFTTYLFMAEAILHPERIKPSDWVDGVLGISRIGATGLVLVDALRSSDNESLGKILKNFGGQYISGFTVGLRMLKDLLTAVSPEQQKHNAPRLTKDTLLGPAMENLPTIVSEKMLHYKLPLAERLTRPGGYKREHAAQRQVSGLTRKTKTRVEQEIHRLQVPGLYPRTGDSVLDNKILGAINKDVEKYLDKVIRSKGYKKLSDVQKKKIIQDQVSRYKKGNAVNYIKVKHYTEKASRINNKEDRLKYMTKLAKKSKLSQKHFGAVVGLLKRKGIKFSKQELRDMYQHFF